MEPTFIGSLKVANS